MKNKYDIIYSIGHDCACSIYLKNHNLRITSGPFDWLTNAPPKTRFELLLNDFNEFMNISDFAFIQKNPEIINDDSCDYYENKKNHFYFYHDFPTGVPLQESFQDVANKYLKRINRFYKNIQNKDRVLLVWFSHYHETSDQEWISFAKMFCEKVGKNVDFLIIQHCQDQYLPQKKQIAPNITRYDLHTIEKDSNGNITTLGKERLCNPLFRKYAIRIPKNKIPQYIINKILLCTLCKCIPNKNIRHNLRYKINNNIQNLIFNQSKD